MAIYPKHGAAEPGFLRFIINVMSSFTGAYLVRFRIIAVLPQELSPVRFLTRAGSYTARKP